MKKSLFRLTDMLELSIAYIFCFSLNLLLDYAKTLDLDAYILKAFLKNFIDYQPLIVSLFTFIVIVFYYQMLERKKAEIFTITTLIISKKPGNTGISRDIRTEFTTDLLLSD